MKALKSFIVIILMFLIGFLFTMGLAHAATDVTFVWDANTETDLAGYRLYQSAISGQYEYGADHCVETIQAGIETVIHHDVPDGTWYWVLTAFDEAGNESGPSNEISDTFDTTAPGPPENLLISLIKKILAWIGDLFGVFRLA